MRWRPRASLQTAPAPRSRRCGSSRARTFAKRSRFPPTGPWWIAACRGISSRMPRVLCWCWHRLRRAPVRSSAPPNVRTSPRSGCIRGFYGPGRPATPDGAAGAAPYARVMTTTAEPEMRRHRAPSLPVEQSARSKRRAHTRGRPTDTASHPRGAAASSRLDTDAPPDPGTEPRYTWQAMGARYDHLRPAS